MSRTAAWTRSSAGIYRRGKEAIVHTRPYAKPAGWWRGPYWAFWAASGPFKTLRAAKRGRVNAGRELRRDSDVSSTALLGKESP